MVMGYLMKVKAKVPFLLESSELALLEESGNFRTWSITFPFTVLAKVSKTSKKNYPKETYLSTFISIPY